MKILDNIEIIDLALRIDDTLIITDVHIGYEEALNKQGVLVPRFQFKEIIKRLGDIFSILKKKVDKIVINGDVKHEFGRISNQEWRHTLQLLDFLGRHCNEIILVKGNHDKILGPIAEKRKVKVVDYYLIEKKANKKDSIVFFKKKKIKQKEEISKIQKEYSRSEALSKDVMVNNKKSIEKKADFLIFKNKESIKKKPLKNFLKNKKNNGILVIHGDKLPSKELLKNIDTIVIGHEHPAVSVTDWPRAELYKCFLLGKYKGKNLIVQPSFNLVTEGTDVIKEQLLSPFLHQSLNDFDVFIIADKIYRFGKLRNLR